MTGLAPTRPPRGGMLRVAALALIVALGMASVANCNGAPRERPAGAPARPPAVTSRPAATTPPPSKGSGSADLDRLTRLVDEAEAAVGAAQSDAASGD